MMNRHNLVAILVACALVGGCSTVPLPPEAAPAAQMSQAEMEALGAQAEQAIAQGEYPDAIALYGRLLAAYPRSAPAWFRLGTVHLRVNDQRMAQYAFERALQIDPTLNKAHANLALTHLRQFRVSAVQAISSEQVSEDNRATLRSLMRDIDRALYPPAATAPTVRQ